jgi:hypothetical protein
MGDSRDDERNGLDSTLKEGAYLEYDLVAAYGQNGADYIVRFLHEHRLKLVQDEKATRWRIEKA